MVPAVLLLLGGAVLGAWLLVSRHSDSRQARGNDPIDRSPVPANDRVAPVPDTRPKKAVPDHPPPSPVPHDPPLPPVAETPQSPREPEADPTPEPNIEPRPAATPPAESVAMFRQLAYRLSFSFYSKHGQATFGGTPEPNAESLFIPYSSNYLHNPDQYEQSVKLELAAYDSLMNEADRDLRKLAEDARKVFLVRMALNLFNEAYGLTPSSSIRRGYPVYLKGLWQQMGAKDQLQAMEKALRTGDDLVAKMKSGDEFSAVARYADMDAADRAAGLWQDGLLPWARKTAGPVVANKLVTIEPQWEQSALTMNFSAVQFDKLRHLLITNVSTNKLTHVIVEARVTNEWKDRAANYYCIPELNAGSTCQLLIHPRWVSRRMYSRDLTLNYSVWAAENSNVGCTMELHNERPVPNAEQYRKNVLSWDEGKYGMLGASLAKSLQVLFGL